MDRTPGPRPPQEAVANEDAAVVARPGLADAVDHRTRRRRRAAWLAAAVLLVAVIVWALAARNHRIAASTAKPRQPPPIPVLAAPVTRGDLGVYFTGLGAVTPIYTVTIHTRVDGQLMQVFFREGQQVKKGELLARIDPRPFEVQLTQAEGQLAKDRATLANAITDLERYAELIRRNAVAQQVLATQQATVEQLRGAVKTDEGQVAAARLNLVYCRITSPIDGRVGLRLVDPGNIVHAADANGLMIITQTRPISVIFALPEDQLDAVLPRLRRSERLTVEAFSRDMVRRISAGRLETIDNQIDQTTGTVKLRALFDNRGDELFPNQFVNARLLIEEKRGVTVLPTAAVQRNAQNTFVWLVKPDHTVAVRQISVGTVDGQRTEAAAGLQPDDVVVTAGVDKLQEGMKVNAQVTANTGAGQAGQGGRP